MYYFYLFERQKDTERKRWTDRERSSTYGFTPKMPETARAKSGQSLETRSQSGSPHQCRDSSTWDVSAVSQVGISRTLESEVQHLDLGGPSAPKCGHPKRWLNSYTPLLNNSQLHSGHLSSAEHRYFCCRRQLLCLDSTVNSLWGCS